MSREQALDELTRPPANPSVLKDDKEYLIKKFDLTTEEFEDIMNLPKKTKYGIFLLVV